MSLVIQIAYLVSAVLFILGLKRLSSPKTARGGNFMAMLAMLLAIVATLFGEQILSYEYIIAGLVVGALIGAIAAKKVQMTTMPQMVAIFNGLGGGASTFVACSEFIQAGGNLPLNVSITIALSVIIGTVTFFGSMIAFAKLQGIIAGKPVTYRAQNLVNGVLILMLIVFGTMLALSPSLLLPPLALVIVSGVLGILAVIPVGGADMPVIISLLNSLSGMAAAATGFVISNNILIISGSLVGASGLILTNIMCAAMNRSISNVLFAGVGGKGGPARGGTEQRSVTRYTADDAVMMLDIAQSVIIIPGYGLAVAQAQHILHEMSQMLIERGLDIRYAIHPVAGRMPGHMNVLLAEANVPYDRLFDMDTINDDFQNTDVALVVGANDVINPVARYKKDSALYGMPVLNADQVKTVMIIKRSLSPGFAGEDNPLFYEDKTMMLFGDAKKMLTDIVQVLKA